LLVAVEAVQTEALALEVVDIFLLLQALIQEQHTP
jgi:hypothetical protein